MHVPSQPTRSQLLADAQAICEELERETGELVSINLDRVQAMLEAIRKTERVGVITDRDEIRSLALGNGTFTTEVEYEAYSRLLDKTNHRKLGARSSMSSRHGRFAPFAPLSAYEDDIEAGRLRC